MTREIDFRGRHKLDGKWIVGNLIKMFGEWCIQNPNSENDIYIVDPETIGQYTGVKDKDGVKIYDGDILRSFIGSLYTVFFLAGSFFARNETTKERSYLYHLDNAPQVIGNIHEKELLNKKESK